MECSSLHRTEISISPGFLVSTGSLGPQTPGSCLWNDSLPANRMSVKVLGKDNMLCKLKLSSPFSLKAREGALPRLNVENRTGRPQGESGSSPASGFCTELRGLQLELATALEHAE